VKHDSAGWDEERRERERKGKERRENRKEKIPLFK
jgi:hypothetical protein